MSDDFIEHIETQEWLSCAMKELTHDEFNIINFMRVGYTIAEASKILAIPQTTAYSRKESAFKKIRDHEKKFRNN